MNLHLLILIRLAFDAAVWPLIHSRPFPHHVLVGCRVVPHCPAPPSTIAPRAHPRHLCLSFSHYPSVHLPSPLCTSLTPVMAAETHVSWRLGSSPAEPTAPTSASGTGGVRVSRLAANSDTDGWNRSVRSSPSLRCICIFQVFQMYVVIILS
jgi:hypothetical protein